MKFKIAMILSMVVLCLSAWASKPDVAKTQKLTLEQNIATPQVKSSQRSSLQKRMNGIVDYFKQRNLAAELVRNGEVVLVTIPASAVFPPNGASIGYEAGKLFDNFGDAIKKGDEFRLVVAVYTDDTGDATYSKQLTDKRIEALKNAFGATASIVGVVNPNINYYSMGNTSMKYPNSTIEGRALNRRIEVYVIPENP